MTIQSKLHEINDTFKIPMYYNSEKKELNTNILEDLELLNTVDSSCNPIYDYFAFTNNNNNNNNTNHNINKKIVQQIAENYTTDVNYLKDTQTLLKKYKCCQEQKSSQEQKSIDILETFDDIKLNLGFKDKYGFIDWDMFEYLNKSQIFLTGLSLYNVISPLISLMIPIFIVIIPFLIIKIRGFEITIHKYIEILKTLASNNSIFKLFTNFNSVDTSQKMYLLISAGFYVFSIYQNVLSCHKFHQNMEHIHKCYQDFSTYLKYTSDNINNYLLFSDPLPSQYQFNDILKTKLKQIDNLHKRISCISDYNFKNYRKISELGYVMKLFYEIYENDEINDILLYSIGFNSYTEIIDNISHNIVQKDLHFVQLKKNKKGKQKKRVKNTFKESYYASLKYDNPVKNDIHLHKNMIVTGPNASGKTTILKTTLINIIVSQQFGCGFYKSGNLIPYDNIHCYLNIPDTSGRDSLFQAEARRCKDILDAIEDSDDTHFCVFDELYSGTNPEEAETSAISFMKYLSNKKNNNVSCMLTTHFTNICNHLSSNKNIQNCQMETLVESDNKNIQYKYKLINGISNVKGGMTILKNMEYPDEIINNK